jgi:outer membrane receptor protein involved in Fe transport
MPSVESTNKQNASLLRLAQTSDGARAASKRTQAANPDALETVIVTAQKRGQSLQDIPLSVAALEAKDLERRSAFEFDDYARGVPSLSVNQDPTLGRGASIPMIRGIAPLGGSGTTAFYVDEMPLHGTGFPDLNMFDIQRVEILRGPQGDLFGASSMGGAIRVITNQPRLDSFEGKGALALSAIESGGVDQRYNGMINIPLLENALALRTAVTYARDGGYIDLAPVAALNTQRETNVNTAESKSARASLKWAATNNLTITPSFIYQDTKENGTRQISRLLSESTGDNLGPNYGINEFTNTRFHIANLLVNYDLGWGDLTSSTASYKQDRNYAWPFTGLIDLIDGQLDPVVDNVNLGEKQIIEELRLVSKLSGPLNFVAGLYYRDDRTRVAEDMIANSLLPEFGTNVAFKKSDQRIKLKDRAVFGQLTYRLSQRWEAGAGLRWFDYRQHDFTPATSGLFGFPVRESGTQEDGYAPTATLTFHATDEHDVYARAAKGFRPGFGFATLLPDACAPELAALGLDPQSAVKQVHSDRLWSYEIGTKTMWFDHRLRLNAAAYYMKWDDVQVSALLAGCGGFYVPSNAGKADVKGSELEMEIRPFKELLLSLGLGYTNARLAEDAPGVGGKNGDRLPGIARWNASAVAEYSFNLFGRRAYISADYTYTGDSNYDFSFTTFKPALRLLGARLGMESRGWDLALVGRNLTDEREIGVCRFDGAERLLQPDASTCVTKPREFGVNISKSF